MVSYVYEDQKTHHYYVFQKGKYYGFYKTQEEAIQKRNKLIEDGTIKPQKHCGRPYKNKETRYIYKTKNGKYSINKIVDGTFTSFGTYTTLKDAIDERNYLEEADWDYDNMEAIENQYK